MSDANSSKLMPALGFLSVIEQGDGTFVGGYLLVNAVGRPLEFHCTAPVVASRPQQILYGPTLRPYLLGEQIGGALIGKSGIPPLWVCTDDPALLAVRGVVSAPVALLASPAADTLPAERRLRFDEAHDGPEKGASRVGFTLGGTSFSVNEAFASDREAICQRWQPHLGQIDFAEPFARIREALAEAQRGAK